MKQFFSFFFSLLAGVLAGLVVYAIAHSIGEWYVGVLKHQGGFVTSNELLSYRYITPAAFALIAGGFAFFITNQKGGNQ